MRHGLAADLKGACRPDSPGDIESAEKRAYAGRRDYCAFFCIRAGDFPAPVGAEGGGPDPRHPGGKVYLL